MLGELGVGYCDGIHEHDIEDEEYGLSKKKLLDLTRKLRTKVSVGAANAKSKMKSLPDLTSLKRDKEGVNFRLYDSRVDLFKANGVEEGERHSDGMTPGPW